MKRLGPVLLLLLTLFPACGRSHRAVPSAAARLYAADCRVCHGPGGRGGVENPLLHQSIPPLRSREWSEPGASRVLERIIREGSLPDGSRPGVVAMPGWQRYLTPSALRSLVVYIRAGLPGPEPPPPSDPADLYRTICLACHRYPAVGAPPAGRPLSFYLKPLLTGSFGRAPKANDGRSLMPALGRVLPRSEFWSLLAFLQTGRDPAVCRVRIPSTDKEKRPPKATKTV